MEDKRSAFRRFLVAGTVERIAGRIGLGREDQFSGGNLLRNGVDFLAGQTGSVELGNLHQLGGAKFPSGERAAFGESGYDDTPRLVVDPDTGIVKVVGGREARKDVDYEEIRDIQFLEDMREPKGTMLDEPLDSGSIRGPESLGAEEAARRAEERAADAKKPDLLNGF